MSRLSPSAALLALIVFFADPSQAAAQAPAVDWAAQRAEAGYMADVGLGLTVAGLSATAAGTGLAFGLRENWGGIIGGGVLWAVGGLLGLSGIPTWIVGGVRAAIAGATDEARPHVAAYWEAAGMTVFYIALGLATIGAGLMGGAVGAQSMDIAAAGGVMIPVGVFVAAFIGAPMWAEGARF